jgi:hypothetical protein
VFGVALQQVEITPGHPPEAHGLLVFSEGQQARWPDRRFPYDVAVDTTEADGSYISTPDRSQPGGEQRWGYRWDGDTLALYTVVYDSKEAPIHCEAKPFVQLRRVPDAALP